MRSGSLLFRSSALKDCQCHMAQYLNNCDNVDEVVYSLMTTTKFVDIL